MAEAGVDKTRLISANIWLTDAKHFAELNAAWGSLGAGRPRAHARVRAVWPDASGHRCGDRRHGAGQGLRSRSPCALTPLCWGAGIVGVSVAVHLQKRGARRRPRRSPCAGL
ncbi:hypothetical protein [Arthrobacter methylotrophus]|uniref:hypothetical protein n=1 Tax=Arthrobacter methylotrophus TaxID=121291 RepID=UPI003CD0A75F